MKFAGDAEHNINWGIRIQAMLVMFTTECKVYTCPPDAGEDDTLGTLN